jgi:glucosamine-6-phosphate deaminase
MIHLLVCDDMKQWARASANVIVETVKSKEHPVLILPTGGTPVPVYEGLAGLCREGKLSMQHVTTFNLDEYIGLPQSHSESYRNFMEKNLFRHVDIKAENAHLPSGSCTDVAAHCAEYEALLAQAGGADLAMLGIGSNGHIGFNEPGTPFDSRTHAVTLDQRTRLDNSRFFSSVDEVPTQAVTMGLATILSARRILLIATGAGKAAILRAALLGPVTESVPGSILQRHPDVTVVLDRPAAAQLDGMLVSAYAEGESGRRLA